MAGMSGAGGDLSDGKRERMGPDDINMGCFFWAIILGLVLWAAYDYYLSGG